MNAKMFSYKVEGVLLEQYNDQLKLSKSFERKAILEPLKPPRALSFALVGVFTTGVGMIFLEAVARAIPASGRGRVGFIELSYH